MTLFSADFLCGHFLLFFLAIPCLIPGVDILHSTMLCKPFSFRFLVLVSLC